jgi:hypothetical protein
MTKHLMRDDTLSNFSSKKQEDIESFAQQICKASTQNVLKFYMDTLKFKSKK